MSVRERSSGLSVYKRLKDISLPDSGIDRKIAHLVRALMAIGVETHASCAGHLDPERHQHPWIGYNPFSVAKITALRYLVQRFNKYHKIRWSVDENWLAPIRRKSRCLSCHGHRMITRRELEQLHRSADQLAKYIFARRNSRNIRELLSVYGI